MVYIVGCNHGIQPIVGDHFLGDDDTVTDQKNHFRELLEKLISTQQFQFVGEEWGLDSETFAQELATRHGVRYASINTTHDDLKRMKIPLDYLEGPYSSEQKMRWNK